MPIKARPDTLAPQVRTITLRLQPNGEQQRGLVDVETRTADLVFASETPVDMWYGTEVLSMAPGAMRMGARQQTMPLLFNHCMDDLLGVVETISVGSDHLARARVRFGKDERGTWAMGQADDRVLVNVSFMYRVFKWVEDTEAETLTAIDWEPYEVSLVTVPADPTAGIGRSATANTAAAGGPQENIVQIVRQGVPAAATASMTHNPAHHAPQGTAQPTQEHHMPVRMQTHRLQEQADSNTSGGGTALQGNTVQNGSGQELQANAQQRGAQGERERITEIDALAKRYQLPDDVRVGMIQRGATIEQARLTAADFTLAEKTAIKSLVTGAGIDTALAANPDSLIAGAITRDANGAATAASVTWPDGSTGAYTATVVSSAFPGAVDAYTVTKGAAIYTQPAVTRNGSGAVINRPAITVA